MMNETQRKRSELPELPPSQGLLADYWQFLRKEKRWWMIPLLVSLILLGAAITLTSPTVAPFIYSFF